MICIKISKNKIGLENDIHTYIYIYVYMYMCACACASERACVCTCVCVCLCYIIPENSTRQSAMDSHTFDRLFDKIVE